MAILFTGRGLCNMRLLEKKHICNKPRSSNNYAKIDVNFFLPFLTQTHPQTKFYQIIRTKKTLSIQHNLNSKKKNLSARQT